MLLTDVHLGNVVCSNCSDQKNTLKKFGYDNPVRCCNTCERLIQMQNMNSNELSKLSPKALKEYINAYHLPSKMALEKSDLVRIIFNTRPISNDNELYYRRNRTKPAERHSGSDDDRKSFSFSNMMQELFTPSSNNSESNHATNSNEQHRREEEQRQRQEQARRMQLQQQQQAQAQARQAQQNAQRQRQAERERLERQQREQYMRQQQEQQQRQRQSNTSSQQRPPSQPSPPIPNTENLLSLHDMIKSNIDPASLSVRTLKSILKANYVEQSHVIEKSELVKLVIRLVDSYKAEHDSSGGGDSGTGGGGSGNEDTLCRICMDAQQNCVFLDCGHMVTCMDCAKKLIESKNECPICREPILKLVHVFRS
ncbi:uncharacterized protein ATC70_004322 [Mucor velutinosus]|uniref:RING-type domain-containing protein n=1 Tax=Mucor velutinosus TaxID=708070 RepID=A0AAN7DTI4_9FUNG|nr:hypothetical protein ATC70_004322 [Mucor velutinosus]